MANGPTLYTLRRPLPAKATIIQRISGAGWMEAGKPLTEQASSRGGKAQTESQNGQKTHVAAKKSVEIIERRKGLFIPPIDDPIPGGWDRRARIREGKVEYAGDEGWADERVSVDSFAMFNYKI